MPRKDFAPSGLPEPRGVRKTAADLEKVHVHVHVRVHVHVHVHVQVHVGGGGGGGGGPGAPGVPATPGADLPPILLLEPCPYSSLSQTHLLPACRIRLQLRRLP